MKFPEKLMRKAFSFLFLVGAMGAFSTQAHAQATGTVVFNSIPSPTPPNVVSKGFECCQTAELGDEVTLEVDTPRRPGFVTVLMSSWSLHSTYPAMPDAGYTHPITLNIYRDAMEAQAHAPWKTMTLEATIPWRPEADPTCPGGTAWRSPTNDQCYNGFAFPLVFDVRDWNEDLPETFIYGVEYNTNTKGYDPIGKPGPYDSLNVGVATVATVGSNVVTGQLYRTNGVGGLVPETTTALYTPTVQFTTFALPVLSNDCKNGAWQNMARTDNTLFKNQGACVTYVTTAK